MKADYTIQKKKHLHLGKNKKYQVLDKIQSCKFICSWIISLYKIRINKYNNQRHSKYKRTRIDFSIQFDLIIIHLSFHEQNMFKANQKQYT